MTLGYDQDHQARRLQARPNPQAKPLETQTKQTLSHVEVKQQPEVLPRRMYLGRTSQIRPDEKRLVSRLADLNEFFGEDAVRRMLQQDLTSARPIFRDPDKRKRLLELHYVLDRLLEVKKPESARFWLFNHDVDLGARPIDVLIERGADSVIAAIDALSAWAYR